VDIIYFYYFISTVKPPFINLTVRVLSKSVAPIIFQRRKAIYINFIPLSRGFSLERLWKRNLLYFGSADLSVQQL